MCTQIETKSIQRSWDVSPWAQEIVEISRNDITPESINFQLNKVLWSLVIIPDGSRSAAAVLPACGKNLRSRTFALFPERISGR